jgi:hypothetical protein
MLRGVAPPEQMPGILAHIASQIPFGCVGESDDVAKAALFWPLMTAASQWHRGLCRWRHGAGLTVTRQAVTLGLSTSTPSALFHAGPSAVIKPALEAARLGPS